MSPSFFPLRWESTRDQWWYASPIDCAAANGHYDLVSELLHLDTNLLIKLTSLRRIRRLETVWDDEEQFNDVAKCRCHVAKKLLLDCQTKEGHNSLVRAGYGGWLLYTAASAGDLGFVKELLDRDPLLVFGEGEYGVTDLFYAAARSKNSEVFRLLLDLAFLRRVSDKNGGEMNRELGGIQHVFSWEMMNRAVHAAARGGNLEMLKELVGDYSDFWAYRDAQGSTVLHTASGRGQVEVVKETISSFDVSAATDNQGNTALHVAAYSGYLTVVEILALASPSSASSRNSGGDTFLHMAVAGLGTPGFRRLDRQIELVARLLRGNIVDIQAIINVRNNNGKTALHMAVHENIQYDLVEILMTVPSIDLNIRDAEGMTPLDLLKQRPNSASSEILIKQLISAGGISSSHDFREISALVSQFKFQGIGSSPGTTFGIPDAEIYLYMDNDDASDVSCDPAGGDLTLYPGKLSQFDCGNLSDDKKSGTSNYAARRLENLLRGPKVTARKAANTGLEDADPLDLYNSCKDLERSPISLRERYATSMSFPNSKRALVFSSLPSPSTKRKFATRLMHGVVQAMPHLVVASQSPSSPLSEPSMSSPAPVNRHMSIQMEGPSDADSLQRNYKRSSFSKKIMNQYFCFGTQGLAVENSISYSRPNQRYKHSSSLVA